MKYLTKTKDQQDLDLRYDVTELACFSSKKVLIMVRNLWFSEEVYVSNMFSSSHC